MTKEIVKEKKEVHSLDAILENHNIVLFNDDVNSFDHVINSLVKYCKHSTVQAEQCAHIVHYNGKCLVKTGNIEKLKPICSALLDKGLSAEIISK
jgi:ATP-dependent Clp protease adaptor protein ClpS